MSGRKRTPLADVRIPAAAIAATVPGEAAANALVAVVAAALASSGLRGAGPDHDLSRESGGNRAATPASSTKPGANGSGGELRRMGRAAVTQLPTAGKTAARRRCRSGKRSKNAAGNRRPRHGGQHHLDHHRQRRPGQKVTAAVTSATEITGKVTSIGGIKVGDLVSALVSGTKMIMRPPKFRTPPASLTGSCQPALRGWSAGGGSKV